MHKENPGKIIIPVYEGKRGHPTLFPMSLVQRVFDGHTLRDIIRDNADVVHPVKVEDKGVIVDIDTMADYEKAVKQN